MTYIAQNEYAALYVPSRFLHHVNPQFTEVLLWLSSHIYDEARHVEVFTKRAVAGGARSYALASTELSLRTLLDETDFSNAALLLNVLGEGTFLDLPTASSNTTPPTQQQQQPPASPTETNADTSTSESHTSTDASTSTPTKQSPSPAQSKPAPPNSPASPDSAPSSPKHSPS